MTDKIEVDELETEAPEWLDGFMEKVAGCFDVGQGDIWYQYGLARDVIVDANDSENVEEATGWYVDVYPAPTLVEGLDDVCIPANLNVELCAVGAYFDEVSSIMWNNTDDEGSSVTIEGLINGALISVEFVSNPPDDATPARKFYKNGRVEDTSSN